MDKMHIYPFVNNGNGVFRPLVPIRVINPLDNTSTCVYALLDTGADDCLFPNYICEATNHNLKGDGVISSVNQGVGEKSINTWKHTFIIELLSPDKNTVVWKGKPMLISCLDHNSAPPLLGFNNFMVNFRITFNYPTKRILIEV